MMPRFRFAAVPLVLAASVLMAATGSAGRGDPAAGKQVFNQCAACHKLDISGTSTVGPNLNKVVGRRAGTLPGFRFSPAMAASGRVWNEAALDAYLMQPSAALPGSRMPFAGLRNAADRANVIAYLKSASR